MPRKQSVLPSEIPVRPSSLNPREKRILLDLRALFVKSAGMNSDGSLYQVEFFPPDVIQSAILAQMTKQSGPVDGGDVSGQSPQIMALRAKLSACDNDDQRVSLLQQLQKAQMDEMTYYSAG